MSNKVNSLQPKLVILSDIWGTLNSDWITTYLQKLDNHFDVKFIDVRTLAGINYKIQEINVVHANFVQYGIQKAVKGLSCIETDYILAFSIGGTIAWKTIALGLKIKHLFAVSSTRLRKEDCHLACSTTLFYGSLDTNKPRALWQKRYSDHTQIYTNEYHEFYRKPSYAHRISNYIIRSTSAHY
ncbi:hypothetical protein ACE939_07405 [Aquimarina sp. W85]|uniref:hypothetical protein n=1 Tax=Aquimarina rhodophyticola TaxID=3342246 RepID=UPI00366C4A01